MRRRDGVAERFAEMIVKRLVERKLVDLRAGEMAVREAVRKVILENLTQEEQIDADTREILQGHSKEIRDTAVDYSRLFSLVKGKLARERGFIL